MEYDKLHEDLIKDFDAQKQMLSEQMELLEPMAKSMQTSAVRRVFRNGWLMFLEVLCWLMVAATVAAIILSDYVYPLHFLNRLIYDDAVTLHFQDTDFQWLKWTVYALIALCGLLFLVISRMLAKIRHKNDFIHLAGKNMKLAAEQVLRRKTSLENLQNKYPIQLPDNADGIAPNLPNMHNDVLL